MPFVEFFNLSQSTYWKQSIVGLVTICVASALLVACTPAPVTDVAPRLDPTPVPVTVEEESPEPQETPPPTVTPEPVSTPERVIQIDAPLDGATVSSPVVVAGGVSVTPFEANLVGRVYSEDDQLLGEAPIQVVGEMGEPGVFEGRIPFWADTSGTGRVEIMEISAKDGSIVALAMVAIHLLPAVTEAHLEIPAPAERVTLPLPILARAGQADETVTAVLRWQDGTELRQEFRALEGEDGRGLIIGLLDWALESKPPLVTTQSAVLELHGADSQWLVHRDVYVLSHDDPNVQSVAVYWAVNENLLPEKRYVVKTPAIGTATLQELLWGPGPRSPHGAGTALPTPQEVLTFPGRQAVWGPRAQLLSLRIEDGVAIADFSSEFWAYGGGSARVQMIRQQITETLTQFPTVSSVQITVEGQSEGVLEP